MEGGRRHNRLVSWAAGRQLEQQCVQSVVLQQQLERPVEQEQHHRFSSRKPLQADMGPIWRGPVKALRVPRQQCLVSGTTPTLPVRPNVCLRAAVGRTKPDAATAARRVGAMTASRPRLTAGCGGGSLAAPSRTSLGPVCAHGFCGGALEKLVHPGSQVRKACARLPERDSHSKPLLVRRASPRHLCAGGQGLDRHW